MVDVFEQVEEELRSDRYKRLARTWLPVAGGVLLVGMAGLTVVSVAGRWFAGSDLPGTAFLTSAKLSSAGSEEKLGGNLPAGVHGPVTAVAVASLTARAPEYAWLSALLFALILWTHRSNIQRLMNGTENRIGKKKEAVERYLQAVEIDKGQAGQPLAHVLLVLRMNIFRFADIDSNRHRSIRNR